MNKTANIIYNKKLSYRRETARQLPTWRGLGPPVHPSALAGYTRCMVESVTRNKRNPQQTYVKRTSR